MVNHHASSPTIVAKGTADRSSKVPALLHNPFLGTFDPYQRSNPITGPKLDLGATFPERVVARSDQRPITAARPATGQWSTTTKLNYTYPEDVADDRQKLRDDLQSRAARRSPVKPRLNARETLQSLRASNESIAF
eukprot:TRINITY_DN9957_c0_g1_i2.p1 TRINITY_DN9957_c0_g1~~TRINITY_DN9957_c0_g1_i2.p1  ORF type:complete len:136 (+),score=14.08 TRINITY_DN9957_c0_g1_i2:247-654(+)